ncbi:hypothetical protein LCGC14_2047980, partial [marine sediment metagenome]
AINIPISDTFALRFAGMSLERDGYTENLAARASIGGGVHKVRVRDLWEG